MGRRANNTPLTEEQKRLAAQWYPFALKIRARWLIKAWRRYGLMVNHEWLDVASIDATHDAVMGAAQTYEFGEIPFPAHLKIRLTWELRDAMYRRGGRLRPIKAMRPCDQRVWDSLSSESLRTYPEPDPIDLDVLECLAENEKDLFRMLWNEGMSERQAAAKLGVSQMQVNRIKAKAVKRLRRMAS